METASEVGAGIAAGLPLRGDDSEVKRALWLTTILIDDMSDYLGVRLPHPTVEEIVSYERRQAWVRDFLDSVRCYYAT